VGQGQRYASLDTCCTHSYVLPLALGSGRPRAWQAAPRRLTLAGRGSTLRLPEPHPGQSLPRLDPILHLLSRGSLIWLLHWQDCVWQADSENHRMKSYAHRGQGLERRRPVMILTPIDSQRYSRYAAHGHGNMEGTRRQCSCFPRRVDRACASATLRALVYAQEMAGEAEKVSL